MSNEQHLTNDIRVPNNDWAVLKQHFPQCFDKNGLFQLEKFKQQLHEQEVYFSSESYGLEWLGKSYARLLASDPATTLLRADTAHNQRPENQNSQNLLVKGDNLEVLKHLSHAYYEKIKMIYIDPPYNTGSDGFVYQDDRKFTTNQLASLAGIDPEKAKRILDFTKSHSNSHSAWLTFMYPRLYIAKQLLQDDGVIFVSIDDNEVAQLRLLMDEIFGEENFVAEFPRITKKAGKTTDLIAKNTDYLICYQKTGNSVFEKNSFEDSKYNGVDEHINERGNFKLSQTLDYSSIQYSKSLDYEIEINGKIYRPGNVSKEQMESRQKANPKSDFCWRWSKELFEFGLREGFVVVKNDRIYTKTYKNAAIKKAKEGYFIEIQERKKSTTSLEFIDNKYSNDNAKKNISQYFSDTVFEYSKPISMIYKIAEITTTPTDLILDFFAGSGTTGDAVWQLNAEDGGNRRFILVQLPEPIEPKKSKAAYDFVKNELGAEPTIAEITRERLKRAAAKLRSEKPDYAGDLGFQVFETLPIWESYELEADTLQPQQTLFDVESLSESDVNALLTTWKTYDGMDLTEALQEIDLGGYRAYYGQGKLYLMDKGFTTDHLVALLARADADPQFSPAAVIAFGYHLDSKNLRELAENLKHYANKKQLDMDFITRY